MPLRSPILAVSLLAFLLITNFTAQADDLKSISQLAEQGQGGQALDRINGYLSLHPTDIQGQFLKGVILAEQGKSADAIRIFSDLNARHPELPEPYNNLAVLYADQGQYDKARQALEMAIKTHPSYATAHENLGDVYARMATDAYDKALQVDKTNTRAQTKLAMVKELFYGSVRPVQVAAKVEVQPAKVVAAPTLLPVPAAKPVAVPVQAPMTSVVAPVTPPEPAKPVTVPAAPNKGIASKDPIGKDVANKPEPTEKPNQDDQKNAVEEAVRGWAKAWSAKNVDGYLAYYGAGFKVPGGDSRSAWEKSRRERISAPASIKVELSGVKIKMEGDDHATVSFHQSYRAGEIAKRTTKSLILKKGGGKWYIEQELTDR